MVRTTGLEGILGAPTGNLFVFCIHAVGLVLLLLSYVGENTAFSALFGEVTITLELPIGLFPKLPTFNSLGAVFLIFRHIFCS